MALKEEERERGAASEEGHTVTAEPLPNERQRRSARHRTRIAAQRDGQQTAAPSGGQRSRTAGAKAVASTHQHGPSFPTPCGPSPSTSAGRERAG